MKLFLESPAFRPGFPLCRGGPLCRGLPLRPHRPLFPALLLALALLGLLTPVRAQAQSDASVRVGISLGGTGLVGLSVEFLRGDASLDLTVGTWSFRDVTTSLVGKYYPGGGDFRAVVGGGLWLVTRFPTEPEERVGYAWVARFPIGAEARVNEDHAVGLEINLDRALAIRRPDPDDNLPPNRRIVPLPGFYYRFRVQD